MVEPCLWHAINYNGLAFFLLANLATGAINVYLPTLLVPWRPANVIVFAYTCSLSLAAFSLYIRRIRLRC